MAAVVPTFVPEANIHSLLTARLTFTGQDQLAASAAALRRLGAGLGWRQSQARDAFISNLTRPFAFMSRAADRIGVRLVESTL